MSAPARFYTLPATRVSHLATLASPALPRRLLRLLKSKARHRQAWIDHLNVHALTTATIAAGGQLIRDLDRYLADQRLRGLKDLADPRLTAACASPTTQSAVLVFDHPHATTAADRLRSARPPTEADVTRWESYGRAAEETDFALWAQRMDEARQELITRLNALRPEDIAILDVAG